MSWYGANITKFYHHSIYIGDYTIIGKGVNGIEMVDIFQYDVNTFKLV